MECRLREFGKLALVLAVIGLGSGCSPHGSWLPTVPDPTPPEPPLNKVVARIDGVDWESTGYTGASWFSFGDHLGFFLDGFADSTIISLMVPSASTGTFVLDGTWEHGSALLILLTPDSSGWYAYPTDASHTGTVTVTRVDSLEIAGDFRFDCSGFGALHRIRRGAFHVPVMPGLAPSLLESVDRRAFGAPQSPRTIASFIDFACSRNARVIKTLARQGRATSRHCQP